VIIKNKNKECMTMTANIIMNQELNGVELYFDSKPLQNILDSLKECGFRWSNFKKCWYAKQNEKTLAEAKKYVESEQEENISNEAIVKITAVRKEKSVILPLWDRVQFIKGMTDASKYDNKFTGSNYNGLSVKETAAEIRKILKDKFPEVKFSITSDYNSINIDVKSSPYCNEKPQETEGFSPYNYRDFEAEHNKELTAILNYCTSLLSSYNWDDSDLQSDYHNSHFYQHVNLDYNYTQTEQNEAIKADITDYRNKLEQAQKEEEERKEVEYQARIKQQEEDHKLYLIRQEEEKKEIEIINNSVNVKDLSEAEQYFVIGSQFAKANKNCTLDQYKEEITAKEFYLQNLKVTREIYFTNEQALNYFSNMLLVDFDFISGTGGSFTDDNRIQSMTDYYNMEEEERKTVLFNLSGIAVYYDNKLQFVIDAQEYSYARYVGLVENVKIQKDYITEQTIINEELINLKEQAEMLINLSAEALSCEPVIYNTWNNSEWIEYKTRIKNIFKKDYFKLTKLIIQQLPEENEELKIAMYKLLIEIDGIQEQFKNADLKQGQKLTMFYIGDFGSMITSRITFDKVEYTKYAQYDKAVKITYTPQGKRSQYYIYKYSDMLVYNGWLELPVEVLHTVEKTGTGMTITKTKYGSCDKKQYDKILEHFVVNGNKPIINTYKPLF
jgi:hypothetical protein